MNEQGDGWWQGSRGTDDVRLVRVGRTKPPAAVVTPAQLRLAAPNTLFGPPRTSPLAKSAKTDEPGSKFVAAEFAEQRRQRQNRRDGAPAVPVSFHAPAAAQNRR